jgi:hypothetical protein
VGETTVVDRGLPFHSTVLPATNLLPVTVRVKSAPPAAVEAGASVLATGVTVRLLAPVILLVNNNNPEVVKLGGVMVRMAKPFPPQRTICVP